MNASASIDHSTVLVTGASGFIGTHLIDRLVNQGCIVHCLVRKTSNLKWIDSSRVQLHYADLTRPNPDEDFLQDVDYVFHCAGLTKAKTCEEYFRINADACRPFYETLANKGKRLKAVVHLSSLAAVGPAGGPDQVVDENTPCRPITYYGKSKLAGENIAREFSSSLPVIVLRPPVVYGPREKNFFLYLKSIHRGWTLRVGKVRRVLSLIHVHDLVRAMVQATEIPAADENVFFITDGKTYSWEDVVETATRYLKVRPRTITLSEKTLGRIAKLSEALARLTHRTPLLDSQRTLDICQSAWTASPEKFFARFKFQPEWDLSSGLPKTLEWYQQQRWI